MYDYGDGDVDDDDDDGDDDDNDDDDADDGRGQLENLNLAECQTVLMHISDQVEKFTVTWLSKTEVPNIGHTVVAPEKLKKNQSSVKLCCSTYGFKGRPQNNVPLFQLSTLQNLNTNNVFYVSIRTA